MNYGQMRRATQSSTTVDTLVSLGDEPNHYSAPLRAMINSPVLRIASWMDP